MSGVGEVAYTVLLGWMRGLVDWIWSMASSGGPGAIVQWFLSNWKFWLVILIVGGVVVDWLMWVVRWRPYRVLFGARVRSTNGNGAAAQLESWDEGVGFYEHETAMDSDPSEWTELTLSTLSEVDPDWAAGVSMAENAPLPYVTEDDPYYSDVYDEPLATNADANVGYWAETPDELEEYAPAEPEDSYYDDPDAQEDSGAAQYDESIYMPPARHRHNTHAEPPANAYEPYEDPYTDSYEEPEPEPEPEPGPVTEDTSPTLYMRTGFWPGTFRSSTKQPPEEEQAPVSWQAQDSAPEAAPEAPRRRRRGIRKSAEPEWDDLPLFHEPPTIPSYNAAERERMLADTRPSRVVRPASVTPVPPRGKQKGPLKTVTGKPALLRGLMKFTAAQEEPIAGLPPMELTDPFLPAARPGNPDFAQDDGEEFFTEGD